MIIFIPPHAARSWRQRRRTWAVLWTVLGLAATALFASPAAAAGPDVLVGVADNDVTVRSVGFFGNDHVSIADNGVFPDHHRQMRIWIRLVGSSCEQDIELQITNPVNDVATLTPFAGCDHGAGLLTTALDLGTAPAGEWRVDFNDREENANGLSAAGEYSVRAVRIDATASATGAVVDFTPADGDNTGATTTTVGPPLDDSIDDGAANQSAGPLNLASQSLPAGVAVGYEPGETYIYDYQSEIAVESQMLHEDYDDATGDSTSTQEMVLSADVHVTSLSRAGTEEWLDFKIVAGEISQEQEDRQIGTNGDYEPTGNDPTVITLDDLPNVQVLRDGSGQVLEIRRSPSVSVDEFTLIEAVVADFHITIDDAVSSWEAAETNRGGQMRRSYELAPRVVVAGDTTVAHDQYTVTGTSSTGTSNDTLVISEDGLLLSVDSRGQQNESTPLRTARLGGDSYTSQNAVTNTSSDHTTINLVDVVVADPAVVSNLLADASAGDVGQLDPEALREQSDAGERRRGHVEAAMTAVTQLPTIDRSVTPITDAQRRAETEAALLVVRALRWHPERVSEFVDFVETAASSSQARVVIGGLLAESDWSIESQQALGTILASDATDQRKLWVALGAAGIEHPQQALVNSIGAYALTSGVSPNVIRAWGGVAGKVAGADTSVAAQLAIMVASSDPAIAAAAADALENLAGPLDTANLRFEDIDREWGDEFGGDKVGGSWQAHVKVLIEEQETGTNVPSVDLGASAEYHFFDEGKEIFDVYLKSSTNTTHVITDETAENWINTVSLPGGTPDGTEGDSPVNLGVVSQQFEFGLDIFEISLIETTFEVPCGIGTETLGDLLLDAEGEPLVNFEKTFDIPLWAIGDKFGFYLDATIGIELLAPYGLGADFCRFGLQTAYFDPSVNLTPEPKPVGGSYTETNDHVPATYILGVHGKLTPQLNLNLALDLRIQFLNAFTLKVGASGTLVRVEVPFEVSANLLWVGDGAYQEVHPYSLPTDTPSWARAGLKLQPCYNLDLAIRLLQDIYVYLEFHLAPWLFNKLPQNIKDLFPWLEEATQPGGLRLDAGPFSVTADWANLVIDLANSACNPFDPLTVTIVDQTTDPDDLRIREFTNPTINGNKVGEQLDTQPGSEQSQHHFCEAKGYDSLAADSEIASDYSQGTVSYFDDGWKSASSTPHRAFNSITCTGYGNGNASTGGSLSIENLRINDAPSSRESQYPQRIPRTEASSYTWDVVNNTADGATIRQFDMRGRYSTNDVLLQDGLTPLDCTGSGVTLTDTPGTEKVWELEAGATATCRNFTFTPTADIELASMRITMTGAESALAWFSTTQGATPPTPMYPTLELVPGELGGDAISSEMSLDVNTSYDLTFDVKNDGEADLTVLRSELTRTLSGATATQPTCATGDGVTTALGGTGWVISPGSEMACELRLTTLGGLNGSIRVSADVDAGRGDSSRLTDDFVIGLSLNETPTNGETDFTVAVEVEGNPDVVGTFDNLMFTITNLNSDQPLTLESAELELEYFRTTTFACEQQPSLTSMDMVATATIAAGGELRCRLQLEAPRPLVAVTGMYGSAQVVARSSGQFEQALTTWGEIPEVNIGEDNGHPVAGSEDGAIHLTGDGPVPHFVSVQRLDSDGQPTGDVHEVGEEFIDGEDNDWTVEITVDWSPEGRVDDYYDVSARFTVPQLPSALPWEPQRIFVYYPDADDTIYFPNVVRLEAGDMVDVYRPIQLPPPSLGQRPDEVILAEGFEVEVGDVVFGPPNEWFPKGVALEVTSVLPNGRTFSSTSPADFVDIFRQAEEQSATTTTTEDFSRTHLLRKDDFTLPHSVDFDGTLTLGGALVHFVDLDLLITEWWQPNVIRRDLTTTFRVAADVHADVHMNAEVSSDLSGGIPVLEELPADIKLAIPVGPGAIPIDINRQVELEWEMKMKEDFDARVAVTFEKVVNSTVRPDGTVYYEAPDYDIELTDYSLESENESIDFTFGWEAEVKFGISGLDELVKGTVGIQGDLALEGRKIPGQVGQATLYRDVTFEAGAEVLSFLPDLGWAQGWVDPILDDDTYFAEWRLNRELWMQWEYGQAYDVPAGPHSQGDWTVYFDDSADHNGGEPEYTVGQATLRGDISYPDQFVVEDDRLEVGSDPTVVLLGDNVLPLTTLSDTTLKVWLRLEGDECASDLEVHVRNVAGGEQTVYPFTDCGNPDTKFQIATVDLGSIVNGETVHDDWQVSFTNLNPAFGPLVVEALRIDYDESGAIGAMVTDDVSVHIGGYGAANQGQIIFTGPSSGAVVENVELDLAIRVDGANCESDVEILVVQPNDVNRVFENEFTSCDGGIVFATLILDDFVMP